MNFLRINLMYSIPCSYITIKSGIHFHCNKINKMDEFWEKKLFNFLIEALCVDNFKKIHILDLRLTHLLYDSDCLGDQIASYNAKRTIMVNLKIENLNDGRNS